MNSFTVYTCKDGYIKFETAVEEMLEGISILKSFPAYKFDNLEVNIPINELKDTIAFLEELEV